MRKRERRPVSDEPAVNLAKSPSAFAFRSPRHHRVNHKSSPTTHTSRDDHAKVQSSVLRGFSKGLGLLRQGVARGWELVTAAGGRTPHERPSGLHSNADPEGAKAGCEVVAPANTDLTPIGDSSSSDKADADSKPALPPSGGVDAVASPDPNPSSNPNPNPNPNPSPNPSPDPTPNPNPSPSPSHHSPSDVCGPDSVTPDPPPPVLNLNGYRGRVLH